MKEKKTSHQSIAITFSQHEEAFVKNACRLMTRIENNQFELGGLVNELVEKSGGIKYGEATLKRIVQHPQLDCTEQHLRRCWSYFQLITEFGDELSKKCPTLRQSAYYQLARFLLAELSPEEKRKWILACATKAHDVGMTVERVAQMVSNELAVLGKLRKPKKKTPQEPKPGADEPEADPGFMPNWPCEGTEAFDVASEVFEGLAVPAKFNKLNQSDMRRGIIKVVRSLGKIIDQLEGPDEDVAGVLGLIAKKLTVAAARLRQAGQGSSSTKQVGGLNVVPISAAADDVDNSDEKEAA